MSCFNCMLTNIKVTVDNIEFWKKNVKKVSLNVAYNKVINRFGATDIVRSLEERNFGQFKMNRKKTKMKRKI